MTMNNIRREKYWLNEYPWLRVQKGHVSITFKVSTKSESRNVQWYIKKTETGQIQVHQV